MSDLTDPGSVEGDVDRVLEQALAGCSLEEDAALVMEALDLGVAIAPLLPGRLLPKQLRSALAAVWPGSASRAALARRHAADENWAGRLVLAQDDRLPDDVLARLVEDPHPCVRLVARHNPAFTDERSRELERELDEAAAPSTLRWRREGLARSERPAVRMRVGSNPLTPPGVLEQLEKDADPRVRLALACNPSTPPAVLRTLSAGRDADMSRALAGHARCPPDVLLELVKDPDYRVQQVLVRNPSLPESVFEVLCASGVGHAELSHPHTPVPLLERAADGIDASRIHVLLDHPRLPDGLRLRIFARFFRTFDPRALALLARDERLPAPLLDALADRVRHHPGDGRCRAVMLALISNAAVPPAERERLVDVLDRAEPDVIVALIANPAIPGPRRAELFESIAADPERAASVAKEPHAPTEVLARLARDGGQRILCGVASNPSTPADVLRELAGSNDRWVKESLARRPEAPLDVIARLIEDPDEVVLRAVEDRGIPAPLRELAERRRSWWLEVSRASESFGEVSSPAVLERAARSSSAAVRAAVAGNGNTPRSAVELLAGDPDMTVRHAVVGRLGLADPAYVPEELLLRDPVRDVRRALASRTRDARVLGALAEDPDPSVRGDVASRDDAPPAVLDRLADDPDASVKSRLAKNASAPAHVLEGLARRGVFESQNRALPHSAWHHILEPIWNDQGRIARALEYASNLDGRLAARLAREAADSPAGASIRRALAGFPATPPEVLEQLVEASQELWWKLAANPATPSHVLETLFRRGDESVRHHLTERRAGLPAAVLEALAGDPDPSTQARAACREGLPAGAQLRLAAATQPRVREALATNPGLLPEAMDRLAADPRIEVREALAANPSLSPAATEALARDADPRVRGALARSAQLSAGSEGLAALTGGAEVAWEILENPHLDPAVRAALERRAARDTAPGSRAVRERLARDAATAPDVLGDLARSADPAIRALVAGRPDVPSGVLETLAGDADVRVRRAVALRGGGRPLVLAAWARSAVPFQRLVAGVHPALPAADRGMLFRSSCWTDRLGVALCPVTPAGELEGLEQDTNAFVRAVARARRT